MTDLIENPEPVIKVDGEVVGSLTRDALELEVAETVAGLRTLELRLVAQGPKDDGTGEGLLYLDDPPLKLGSKLEVALGAGDDARTVFTGKVSAMEGSFDAERNPEVAVFAEDALMTLRMTRRCHTYSQLTDAGLAEEIARFHELPVEARAPGPKWDVVQQWNQSDLAFLRDRARLIQAEVWVKDGTLHFATRSNRGGEKVELTLGVDLLKVDVRADLAHQRSKVTVSGYDASRREGFGKSAENAAVQAEAPQGRTGVQLVGEAFGAEKVTSLRVREVPLIEAEAEALAKAELLRRARQFVIAVGTTRGSATLDVGSTVKLTGLSKGLSGDGYYVTALKHTWSRTGGFRTHFEAERATLNDNP
jgi:uncharacterized protein